MNHWLMKTEPDELGIDDFAREPHRDFMWDGVRNYQARNFIRTMQPGDQVVLYHSSCKHIGAAGIVEVTRAAYADPEQFNPDSAYYDPKSSVTEPRWDAVDLRFVDKFPRIIPLSELKTLSALADCALVRKGNRLSVMPLSANEYKAVLATTNR